MSFVQLGSAGHMTGAHGLIVDEQSSVLCSSRALADVMRPQGHCNTDHMERDLNIVVHVQHYENMDTRTPINNLRKYGCTGHFCSHYAAAAVAWWDFLGRGWVSEEHPKGVVRFLCSA